MRIGIARIQSKVVGCAIPVMAVLLEVLWAHACLVQFSRWQDLAWPRPPMGLGYAVLLALASEAVTRFALSLEWREAQVRALALSLLMVLLLTVVRLALDGGYSLLDLGWGTFAVENLPFVIAGLLFGIYLVWRGIAIGRQQVEFDDLYRKFLFGLTALIILLLFSGIATRGDGLQHTLSSVGVYVIAYFALGLLGLGILNLRAIQEAILRHEGSGRVVSRRWTVLLLGVVTAVILTGLGIAATFSFRMASTVLGYLNIFANWLLIAFLYVVGYPLGVLAAGLVYVLRFLVRLFGGGKGETPEFSPPDLSGIQNATQGEAVWHMPHAAMLALKWGLVALLALLVLFLLARAISRYWRGEKEEDVEEVSESLWTWEEFKGDLLGLLRRLLDWFRRRRVASLTIPNPTPPIASLEADSIGRLLTVREIYQGLLWEGYTSGVPRSDYETPYEYRVRFTASHPDFTVDVAALTQAYVGVRYGLREPPADELTALNRLWQRLRASVRALRQRDQAP